MRIKKMIVLTNHQINEDNDLQDFISNSPNWYFKKTLMTIAKENYYFDIGTEFRQHSS